MAEEVIHHVDETSGSGSNLAVGILLVFLAFIVLFVLFSRGVFNGFSGTNNGFSVPSSIDVNLNR